LILGEAPLFLKDDYVLALPQSVERVIKSRLFELPFYKSFNFIESPGLMISQDLCSLLTGSVSKYIHTES
jgi:hypothetical protein